MFFWRVTQKMLKEFPRKHLWWSPVLIKLGSSNADVFLWIFKFSYCFFHFFSLFLNMYGNDFGRIQSEFRGIWMKMYRSDNHYTTTLSLNKFFFQKGSNSSLYRKYIWKTMIISQIKYKFKKKLSLMFIWSFSYQNVFE